MPRRVRTYSNGLGSDSMNLMVSIGSVLFGLGMGPGRAGARSTPVRRMADASLAAAVAAIGRILDRRGRAKDNTRR